LSFFRWDAHARGPSLAQSGWVGLIEGPIILFFRMRWTQPSRMSWVEMGLAHFCLCWQKATSAGHELIHVIHANKEIKCRRKKENVWIPEMIPFISLRWILEIILFYFISFLKAFAFFFFTSLPHKAFIRPSSVSIINRG